MGRILGPTPENALSEPPKSNGAVGPKIRARFQKLALSTSFQVVLSGVTASLPRLAPSLVSVQLSCRAPVSPLWHRKAQHGCIIMAEAEYAAGPRLISDSNSFTAWSDVPENLCKTILRLLPSEH